MPRSLRTGTPIELDTEIEKTAKRLRKQAKLRKKQPKSGTSSSSTPPIINIWEGIPFSSKTDTETPTSSPNQTSPPLSPPHFSYAPFDTESLVSNSPPPTEYTSDTDTSNTETPSSPTRSPTHETMGEPQVTLRQWATQDVTQQPLCITYPEAMNFELKSGLIHLLPSFRGVENEDPATQISQGISCGLLGNEATYRYGGPNQAKGIPLRGA